MWRIRSNLDPLLRTASSYATQCTYQSSLLISLNHANTTPQTDNVGLNPHLIATSTIANVVAAFPRGQWSACFADAMVEEIEIKPWCHTTANDGFIEAILGNEVMAPFDG
jgi:hypothetical protein